MLRHVLAHNRRGGARHYAELAEILAPECAGQGSQARAALLIDGSTNWSPTSGIAPRLRDHGIADEDSPMLASEAMKQTRLLVNNPVPDRREDARRLYEAAW